MPSASNLVRHLSQHSATYRRLETDREYRERLWASGKVTPHWAFEAREYCGTALDSVGDHLGVPRRIVEVVG